MHWGFVRPFRLAPTDQMTSLSTATSITLGEARSAAGAGCGIALLEGNQVAVLWLDWAGSIVGTNGAEGASVWSTPAPVLAQTPPGGFSALALTGDCRTGWKLAAQAVGDASGTWRVWRKNSWRDPWIPGPEADAADNPPTLPPEAGHLATIRHGDAEFALRCGRRVVGIPPRFPSAGLVFCRKREGQWSDFGFADETPDAEVTAAAMAARGKFLIAAYVRRSGERSECNVVQAPLGREADSRSVWRSLPPYPQEPGMAGPMTGMHNGVLIMAGGANFPGVPLAAGGKKVWHDAIHVLVPGETAWRAAGRLPAPRAYGAAVSLPGGVLVAGGENSGNVFQDSLMLRWDGEKVLIESGPALPAAITSAMAVRLGGHVYLAGGYEHGSPRTSCRHFWRLDASNPKSGWQALPSWPGPARAQGVMAAVAGVVYLFSGLSVATASDGTPQTTYLHDAYRYLPDGRAWEKLPDLPWSAVAAPSPAPVTGNPPRIFILGGVDGRQAGRLPRDTRLPADILVFDVTRHAWQLWPEPWPDPVVTVPAIESDAGWIIASGETMAGQRTTRAWAWQIGTDPAHPSGQTLAP
jgi:N-acetylneuraminic acid mutarotase